jgi:hypothetical protein
MVWDGTRVMHALSHANTGYMPLVFHPDAPAYGRESIMRAFFGGMGGSFRRELRYSLLP